MVSVSVGVRVTASMVAAQFLEAGLNTIVKAASTNGMSNLVFVLYSNILGFFFLLLSTFLYHRYHKMRAPPPIPTSILCRIFILSSISTAVQMLMYTGIEYSSPALSSALMDLVPAFTFILAICSRMEKLNLKLNSSKAKVIGTVVTIAGALIVTLYKGNALTSSSLLNKALGKSGTRLSGQPDWNWIHGGFLLAIATFGLSVLYIAQTWIIKDYPEELVVTTICCGFNVIISGIVSLIAEGNRKGWVLGPDMELVAVIYSGICVTSLRSVVYAWACRTKGPVYVAMFSPLGMVIALGMGLIFLGESLYLGSLIGAAIIATGFYAVMWGQAQEEKMANENNENNKVVPSEAAPLLP